MHYFDWNNAIGRQLFNPQRAGQPVYLCLTQEQIVEAGKDYSVLIADKTNTEIWSDFCRSAREFSENNPLVAGINKCFDEQGRIKSSQTIGVTTYRTDFPSYLSLIVLAVLPLTEERNDLNTNNYYDRAGHYLTNHQLPTLKRGDLTQSQNWLPVWDRLEKWSKQLKHGELGVFEAGRFSSNNYKYVGKVFAQCLMPPKARTLLPRLFVKVDWVPKQYRSYDNYRELLENCQSELGIREWILQAVRREDELGHSVVRQLVQAYGHWSGRTDTPVTPISHSLRSAGQVTHENIQKGFTYVRLYLTFKDPGVNNYQLELAYRLHTDNTFSESLYFGNQPCVEERYGWSRVLALSFLEGLRVADETNKWRGRFPYNAIRVFERGSMHGLSRDCWVEVDTLSKIHEMVLMCDAGTAEQVQVWGSHFPAGQFREWQAGDWFEKNSQLVNYRFFACQGPTEPLNEQFGLPTQKLIHLKGGLKLSSRTYYTHHLPVVFVEHGDGIETVVAEYADKTTFPLVQDTENRNLYHIPVELVRLDCNVWFVVAGESVRSEIAYQFCIEASANGIIQPRRDLWGQLQAESDTTEPGCQGVRLHGINAAHQHSYLPAFYPGPRPSECLPEIYNQPVGPGDELLVYLTGRKQGKSEHFNQAFDAIRYTLQANKPTIEKPLNRWSMMAYDTLGFLDYDYTSGTFVMAESALIPLPSRCGRRALLVGGRTLALFDCIRESAARLNVFVSIEAQNRPELLLPSIITLSTNDETTLNGCKAIQTVAEVVGIPYLSQTLPQWGLLELSGKISAFSESFLQTPDETAASLGWSEHVFNPDTLSFEPAGLTQPDLQLALIHYELHSWQHRYLLWIDGHGYPVERDWGRYMLLSLLKKQVIYKSSYSKNVAVPATLPLPGLLARAFTLTSGKLPALQLLKLNGQTRNYLIYEDTGLLADNYFRNLGQIVQPTTAF